MTEDSMEIELQRLIEECAQYHVEGRHRLALRCYQKVMALVAPSGDFTATAILLSAIGMEYRDCNEYHHAAELLVTALTIVPKVEETLELQASIKKKLAIVFEDIYGPQKPEVMQLLEESRDDYRKRGDLAQEANVLQHIGGSLVQLKQFEKGDRVLTEALQKARTANDVQLEGWIYDNLSDLEIERNDWGMALEYARTARAKARLVGDLEAEGDTWVNEARIQMRMGHPQTALEHATQALQLFSEVSNQRRIIYAYRHVAKAYIGLNQLDEALAAIQKAMRAAVGFQLWHDQVLLLFALCRIELERHNLGLAHQHAVEARALAERENMDDLIDEAEQLLRECR